MRTAAALLTATLVALALLAGPAAAGTWRLIDTASKITFSYLENGQTIEGVFENFDGEANFDQDDFSDASVTLRVETGSVSFGDPLRDHFARSVDWFDSENRPLATFELVRMTRLDDGRFRANGVLSLRGIEREIDATLTISRQAGEVAAQGELAFARSAFGVGTGFSALLADVGDIITVRFALVGAPDDAPRVR